MQRPTLNSGRSDHILGTLALALTFRVVSFCSFTHLQPFGGHSRVEFIYEGLLA